MAGWRMISARKRIWGWYFFRLGQSARYSTLLLTFVFGTLFRRSRPGLLHGRLGMRRRGRQGRCAEPIGAGVGQSPRFVIMAVYWPRSWGDC